MATIQRSDPISSISSGPGIAAAPKPWTIFRHNMKLAYWLSAVLAIATLIVAAAGVFHPSLFRDTAMTAGNA